MSEHDLRNDPQSGTSGGVWHWLWARFVAFRAARAERIARWQRERKQKTGWHVRNLMPAGRPTGSSPWKAAST